MAPLFKAFGMTVVGITSGVRQVPGFDHVYDKAHLPSVIRELDYFVLLTPYTASTHHLINAEMIGAMKPDAYLINLARGGVVDEAALLESLKQKKIAGAALDVFEEEPVKPNNPLWEMENVIITCHQSATHDGSARTNVPIINENIRYFLKGDLKNMKNVVRPKGRTDVARD
jgi:D-2-hydroxyacid dehydrogenase (NADP+)